MESALRSEDYETPRAGGRAAPGGRGSLEMDLRERGEEAEELRTPSTS